MKMTHRQWIAFCSCCESNRAFRHPFWWAVISSWDSSRSRVAQSYRRRIQTGMDDNHVTVVLSAWRASGIFNSAQNNKHIMPTTSRARFEEHFKGANHTKLVESPDCYAHPTVQSMWLAWQAAYQHAEAGKRECVEALSRLMDDPASGSAKDNARRVLAGLRENEG